MSDDLTTGLCLVGVVGLAAAILFVRDRLKKGLGRRFIEPTAQIATAIGRFLRPAVYVTAVIVFGGVLIGAVSENWGEIACWVNNETGELGRTCALQKISELNGYRDAEVTGVTGIAEISGNVKRVEFKWRLRPTKQNPNPQQVDSAVTFRKYDDGWRPSQ